MEKEQNEWINALSEQDIPAEVVNWESIIAVPEENELNGDSERLNAEDTIGEPPNAEK